MTSIEWTRGDDGTAGATWNPAVSGCSMISPGCTNCYAMKQAHRFSGPSGHARYRGLTVLGKHGPRWTGEVRITNDALDAPLHWKKPRRIFVNSMTDLFHEDVPNETIAVVFGVMAACPQHTFQVLTKRAERLAKWFEWIRYHYGEMRHTPAEGCRYEAMERIEHRRPDGSALPGPTQALFGYDTRWPLPNVHLGVSVESSDYLWRVDELIRTPAAVRFVSAEPLLGAVDFDGRLGWSDLNDRLALQGACAHGHAPWTRCEDEACTFEMGRGVDWVIVGGESGAGARPCAVEWIESIVSQCRAAQVPVFVKQLGRVVHWNGIQGGERGVWPPGGEIEDIGAGFRKHLVDQKGGDMDEWLPSLRVREFPC